MKLKRILLAAMTTLALGACSHMSKGPENCGCSAKAEAKKDCKGGECDLKAKKCADCEKAEGTSSK